MKMKTGSELAALWFLLSAVLDPAACVISPNLIDPLILEEQLLWVNGAKGEVSTYRIPLLTFTPKGSLLAFAEARKSSASDAGAKFIVMRRSIDKGYTWSPNTFIVDDGTQADGLNLGSVVVDEVHGSIILIYTVCFHLYHCQPSSIMMVQSKDDGLSWSQPRNLSLQLGIKNFAPGPGFGLQLRHGEKNGRLVVCGHGTLEGDGVFLIISDDYGQTWRNGASLKSIPYNQPKKAQDFNPDECQPVELTDGTILINVRNQNSYHCKCRIVVRSRDYGETLPVEDLSFDYELRDPAVAAGAVQKGGVLFFTNPSNEQQRINMTLRWSLNGGYAWEKKAVQIWPGPSGYSCMTSIDSNAPDDEKHIFVIFEKGFKISDETISFVKVHLYSGR